MTARFGRLKEFWARHRTLFWMLHSAWALATGAAIAWASHERYHLVGWVALALAVTWASTLYFGRAAASGTDGPPKLVHEVTSYVTRVMYQETLFFLIPFYAYSTVVRSPNVGFVILLGGLAVFSCIDIPFDRWLRTKPVFGFAFFAVVAFAALNLLLPLTFGLRVQFATPLAALLAIAVALPLVVRSAASEGNARTKLAGAALALVVIATAFPVLVPPAPLRMLSATFSSGIERESLTLTDTLPGTVTSADTGPTLVVLVHIFAPTDLPARVHLVWRRDREILRTSRDVEIVAHTSGFRAWDSWRPAGGAVLPGDYEVVLETAGGRVIGKANLSVRAPS